VGTTEEPRSWTGEFLPDAGAVREARVELADGLAGADFAPDAIEDALLVLTELVGNAVRHARTHLTVSASYAEGFLRLEVFDLDTRPPALLGLDDDSTSGRGLHIVAAIASDWGWRTARDPDGQPGKVVWAELGGSASQEHGQPE
jgi:anti-sigma regulatory factor (Ser/Thr protein kinase)